MVIEKGGRRAGGREPRKTAQEMIASRMKGKRCVCCRVRSARPVRCRENRLADGPGKKSGGGPIQPRPCLRDIHT